MRTLLHGIRHQQKKGALKEHKVKEIIICAKIEKDDQKLNILSIYLPEDNKTN